MNRSRLKPKKGWITSRTAKISSSSPHFPVLLFLFFFSIVSGGTRLAVALDGMALSMTPTRRQLHIQQNTRDRLIAIECQD